MGRLIGIYVAPEKTAALQETQQVTALAGKGLEGDRYCAGQGTFSKGDPANEVTLVEIEAIEALERDYDIKLRPAETRRNLLTEGVALNHLVGKDFRIGAVSLRGIRLCEPCGHLEKLTANGVEQGLRHRGGLRAQVVTGGIMQVGDDLG
jgi:MOSC domain-containing protein YiiM